MDTALDAFAAEVRRADDALRLDRAALLIAAGETPDLDIEACVAQIDEIAAGVPRPAGALGAVPRELAATMRWHLFTHLGFCGNEHDYYDPRNSYLDQVLARRTGIPISLAVVYLEVARRVGLDAAGVSYPRHFLVKYRDGEGDWIVDPFRGGAEVNSARFRAELVEQGGASEQVIDYHLSAVTRRQILTRMLTNLKLIYLDRRDNARALRIQDYLLALNPWSIEDFRDRGVLRGRTGDTAGALADLETYLAHAEPAEDAPAVRRLMARLRGGQP